MAASLTTFAEVVVEDVVVVLDSGTPFEVIAVDSLFEGADSSFTSSLLEPIVVALVVVVVATVLLSVACSSCPACGAC